MPTRKQIIVHVTPDEHAAVARLAKDNKRSIGNQLWFMIANGIKLEVKK